MGQSVVSKRWHSSYPDYVRKEVDIPDITLSQVLENTVYQFPDNLAISYRGQVLTYTELKKQVDEFASALQQSGIQKGDRVAILMPNCTQYVVTYFGILAAGGIIVQINPLSTERELQYIIENSGAETIIALDTLHPVVNAVMNLRNTIWVSLQKNEGDIPAGQSFEAFMQKSTGQIEPPEMNPAEDTAVIQYTGGTTGRSKGAMLTHRNLVANIEQHHELYRSFMFSGVERVLIVLPLFHVYGMTICMNLGIRQGSCLILMERFDPDKVLETIKREQPTRFPGVPTMYVALNAHHKLMESGLDSIKFFQCGGAPMPIEIIHEFERKTGGKISESYGLSEASPGALGQPSTDRRKLGTIGVPVPSSDCKIVDLTTGTQELPPGEVGELILKGPHVMKGYWNMPEETAAALRDGWLYTGDVATMDEDGYVYIVDRKKDIIIASGFNVYPREVEEVLYEHPAILEAVVIGVEDEYRGETVKAFVVLREGAQAMAEDLIAHCKKYLSPYKVPKIVEFRSSLPKTNVGKLLRRAVTANPYWPEYDSVRCPRFARNRVLSEEIRGKVSTDDFPSACR